MSGGSSLSRPQYDFLSSAADFVVYGGAAGGGKTHALTLDPMRHCQGPYQSPEFRGAIFRKTSPQLYKPGGLVDHCKEMYGPLRATFNHTWNEFRFPCGAKVSLNTLQFNKDLNNYQGAQFDYLGIDEATHFTEQEVFFLQARCRSTSGLRSVVRLTCNPDNDSWLYPFLAWWIDPDTGYPVQERSGVVRHFTRIDGKFTWYDEPQYDAETGEKISISSTFIPATLEDNTALTTKDPGYRQKLLSMSEAEKERFLNGCWLASSKTDSEWPRELFLNLFVEDDEFPRYENRNLVQMFAIDPSKGRSVKQGDYSAIVSLAQTQHLAFVDADLKRRHPSQIIEDLFLFCNDPLHTIRSGDLIGIESLQFQSLFRDLILRFAQDHPEYALSRYLMAKNPIIPIEDNTPKMLRIRRLSNRWKNREFRFRKNASTSLLLYQAKQFDGIDAKGKHNDGLDALEMADQMPRHLREMFKR